jgi:hypothetical protein
MKHEMEKRLHRVRISLDKSRVKCPLANECDKAVNCDLCNEFYKKCSIFIQYSK